MNLGGSKRRKRLHDSSFPSHACESRAAAARQPAEAETPLEVPRVAERSSGQKNPRNEESHCRLHSRKSTPPSRNISLGNEIADAGKRSAKEHCTGLRIFRQICRSTPCLPIHFLDGPSRTLGDLYSSPYTRFILVKFHSKLASLDCKTRG